MKIKTQKKVESLLEGKKMKQFYSQFKFLKNGSEELLQQWGRLFGVTHNAWQNKAGIELEDIFDRLICYPA